MKPLQDEPRLGAGEQRAEGEQDRGREQRMSAWEACGEDLRGTWYEVRSRTREGQLRHRANRLPKDAGGQKQKAVGASTREPEISGHDDDERPEDDRAAKARDIAQHLSEPYWPDETRGIACNAEPEQDGSIEGGGVPLDHLSRQPADRNQTSRGDSNHCETSDARAPR